MLKNGLLSLLMFALVGCAGLFGEGDRTQPPSSQQSPLQQPQSQSPQPQTSQSQASPSVAQRPTSDAIAQSSETPDPAPQVIIEAPPADPETPPFFARVLDVETTSDGTSGDYNFSVTIESEETGCDAYANWWEVITPGGQLLYRRILAHSHVNEQPFTRSGGPVPVQANQPVIVRVHMHPYGYSPEVMEGLAGSALIPTTLPADFASALATVEPLTTGCTF